MFSADAYYAKDRPVVPDSVYDQLFREVQAIEAANPEWVRLDSPNLRVGAAPLKEFGQVEHGEPMLSIDNALNAEEAAAFGIRVASELGLDPEDVLYGKEQPGRIRLWLRHVQPAGCQTYAWHGHCTGH